ncbi:hypothetical protein [Zunongwangia profunda]|uniref:hypothetical protein n=1 Tax=Zunongwangia profunda TaxID=398743 RepID=UPI001D18D5DA|nr:hypothetical protein [Zunongwangia profunda]MCC4231026.1 hypothetical protein [Zunongwangia profunda]
MKKLLNTSLIVIFLLNISCMKYKSEKSITIPYNFDGIWELRNGESQIKIISFKNKKVTLTINNNKFHGKLIFHKKTTSTNLGFYQKSITSNSPVIEYFEDGKKITVPIVYENINDESFITLKDIVYQKIK